MGDFPGFAHVYRPAGRKEPFAHQLWETVTSSSAVTSRLIFPTAPLVIGVASEPGCQEQQNTDSYRVVEMYLPAPDGIVGEVVPVAIIATGTNDPETSTVTSQRAVDLLYAALRRVSDQPIQQRLVEAVQQAQQPISAQPTVHPANSPCAIAVGAVWRNTFYLTYIGECRAYLLRNGALQQLTAAPKVTTISLPPIFPPRQQRPALLTAPKRQNQEPFTTAAVSSTVPMESSPSDLVLQHSNQIELRKGDTLLLCTPGLYRVVSEEAIQNAVVQQQQPQAAAWQLAIQANQAQAADSYTVLILQPTDGQASVGTADNRKRTMARGLKVLACLLLVIVPLFVFAQLGNAPSLAEPKALPTALAPLHQQTVPFAASPAKGTAPFVAPSAQSPAGDETVATPPLPDQAAVVDGATATRSQESLPAALIVQRLWTRLALTTTLMTFSQNVPIILERAGNAVAAAHTATASAPLPTPTPTATATPLPPATPTRPRQLRPATPTPARTPTVQAAQPVRTDFTNATVKLLEPAENDTLTDKRPFRWQANFVLPPGYAFELIFWQSGQDPLKQGKGYAGLTTGQQINAGYDHLRIRDGREGEYRWGVLLVKQEPYQRIKYLGGARVIYIKQK